MSSVDENITHCLEQIDSAFVQAIDVVSSISKSIKVISSNMRELDMHSRKWFELFNLCEMSNKVDPVARESLGTGLLAESEMVPTRLSTGDTGELPSFLREDSNDDLRTLSPPRTTTVYMPLVTPGGDFDTSAMDISTSSYGGYSPPHTPVLKRRKSEILARVSLGLDLHEPPLPTTSSPANQKMSTADILQVDANGDDTTLHLSSVPHVTTSSDMADRTTTMTASMNPSSSTSFFPVSFINEYILYI